MMHSLKKRVEDLESKGAGGLVLLLVSWLSRGGRETATHDGVTDTQRQDESTEQFRRRLGQSLGKDKGPHFIWVSELDAAL